MEIPLPLLGSYFSTQQRNFTIPAPAFVPIMSPNPNRWGFIVTQINNQPTELDITQDLTTGPIAILGTAGDRFERFFRDWGCLTQLQWFAGTNIGPTTICVTEILYQPPQQLVSESLP